MTKNLVLVRYLTSVIKHPFFASSLIMVVGSNLHNLGQFVFHLLAARFLGKAGYGDLVTILTMMGLVAIIQISFGLPVVKIISSEKSLSNIVNLTKWLNWWSLWAGVTVGGIIVVIAPFIVYFFHIKDPIAVYILGVVFFFFVNINMGRSVLQGLLRFDRYIVSLLAEVWVKILLAIPLFVLGYAVFGAMIALLIGIVSAFFIVRSSFSDYLIGPRGEKPNIRPFLKYSIPVFVQGVALTSMYSMDLLLVKHFFSAEEAGIYASLAKLGSIAFFAASPIAHVMFPMIAKRHSHSDPYHKLFYLSAVVVVSVAGSVTLFYYLFPRIPISILYGPAFLEGAPVLWWFSFFMGLLSLAMLFIQFYLSIGKTRIVLVFVIAALLQIVLIWFIHPNLLTVIRLSLMVAALLVLSLLVYFPYHHRWYKEENSYR